MTTKTAPALTFTGACHAIPTPAATIVVTCIRPGHSYRTAVCYPSTGVEVDELSKSYKCQSDAWQAARTAYALFIKGWTIVEAIDLVAVLNAAANLDQDTTEAHQ